MELFTEFLAFVGRAPKAAVYAVISLSSMLQQWFPPYPGDSFAIAAGVLSGGEGFSRILLFLTFWLSTVISSIGLFELGLGLGKRVLRSKIALRFFPLESQQKAHETVKKYGVRTFFICKFLPGLNSVVILVGAGLKFRRSRAYTGMILAALLHNAIFFIAGWALGHNMEKIALFVRTYTAVSIVLLVAVVVIAAVILLRKYMAKKANK